MTASIDDVLGDLATWSGVTGQIRVHFEEEDAQPGWSEARTAVRTRKVTVHRSWVAEPASGDQFTVLETAEVFEITDEAPVLDRDGYWLCAARPV